MSNILLRTTLSGIEIKTDENEKSCYVIKIIKLCFTIESTNKGGKLRKTGKKNTEKIFGAPDHMITFSHVPKAKFNHPISSLCKCRQNEEDD